MRRSLILLLLALLAGCGPKTLNDHPIIPSTSGDGLLVSVDGQTLTTGQAFPDAKRDSTVKIGLAVGTNCPQPAMKFYLINPPAGFTLTVATPAKPCGYDAQLHIDPSVDLGNFQLEFGGVFLVSGNTIPPEVHSLKVVP